MFSKRKIIVVAAWLLIFMIIMFIGCDRGSPSNAEIKEAVNVSVLSQSLKDVQVIKVGEPYLANDIFGKEREYWPVKLSMTYADGSTGEIRVELYKDDFREWKLVVSRPFG